MYVPDSFKNENIKSLLKHIQTHSFGIIATNSKDGPLATHIPFLHVDDGTKYGKLLGHMARVNTQTEFLTKETALIIFPGPHAYISPSYYPSGTGVPTWDYTSVHVYGNISEVVGEQKLQQQITMTKHFEKDFKEPWTIEKLSKKMIQQMLCAIYAFEMPISRIEGQWKISQNRPEIDRQGVKKALTKRSDSQENTVADLIR